MYGLLNAHIGTCGHVDRNPYPAPPLSPPFGLYAFFLFKTIFDMRIVLSTHIKDEIPKIFVLQKKKKKKTSPRVVKPEGRGYLLGRI